MVLEITTLARVKTMAGLSTTEADARITELIPEVSQIAEDTLGRWLQVQRRTEVYGLRPNKRYLTLKGNPITSVVSVKYGPSRTFTDVPVLDSATYDILSDQGQLYFKPEAISSWYTPGFVEVVYDGGMAADTANFEDLYPRIAGAATLEVINRLNRSKSPQGNLRSFETGVAYEKELAPLEDFHTALLSHMSPRALL